MYIYTGDFQSEFCANAVFCPTVSGSTPPALIAEESCHSSGVLPSCNSVDDFVPTSDWASKKNRIFIYRTSDTPSHNCVDDFVPQTHLNCVDDFLPQTGRKKIEYLYIVPHTKLQVTVWMTSYLRLGEYLSIVPHTKLYVTVWMTSYLGNILTVSMTSYLRETVL